jgi:antirestriction protein
MLDNGVTSDYHSYMTTAIFTQKLENRKMASVRDAMTLLNVSRPTVMKWLQDGKFENAAKDDGLTGEWNIPRQDIEAVRQELIADYESKIERLMELSKLSWQ